MSEKKSLLSLEQIHKHYLLPDNQTPPAVLTGIDFKITPGETVAITGPSGCGKSTLLNIMGLLDSPSSGVVTLKGQDTSKLTEPQRAHLRNREIGFIFQLHHLLPQCTVLENVLLPVLAQSKQSTEEEQTRALELLRSAGLEQKSHRFPSQLSGGEQLRTSVVRALINRPALLLADEPTGSLDQRTALAVMELLADLNQEYGLAIVLVTHAPDLAKKMQYQYHLQTGKLVRS